MATDIGWTVGPLLNAETVRVEDTAILDAGMAPVGRRGMT